MGYVPFVKTTDRKELHLVAHVEPNSTFDEEVTQVLDILSALKVSIEQTSLEQRKPMVKST